MVNDAGQVRQMDAMTEHDHLHYRQSSYITAKFL